MAGPAEFFMEIILGGGQFDDFNNQGTSTFDILVTFSTFNFFLMFMMRKEYCLLLSLYLMGSFEVYGLGSLLCQGPGSSGCKKKYKTGRYGDFFHVFPPESVCLFFYMLHQLGLK